MKIAVISDIHSNLEALSVALDAIDAEGVDAIYCLGDIVGYGADAAACVDLVRETCAAVVRGNHDEAVALGRDMHFLPRDAQYAAHHNRDQLTDDQLAYLADLPLKLEVEGGTLVHATPEAPHRWHRVDSYPIALAQFAHFDTDVCFIGHTHIPAVMADRMGVFHVRRGYRYLINVGSVGQPRDEQPGLSLVFFDLDAFSCEIVRLPYDVERAANKILAAGLPPTLAERLMVGQ